jgi:hypothetical protein
MTQYKIVQLAQQGDVQAIAYLIVRSPQAQGMAVKGLARK